MYRNFIKPSSVYICNKDNKTKNYLQQTKMNQIKIEFPDSNIKDCLPDMINKYAFDNNEYPTHLYVNYEGYKAIFNATNDVDSTLNFAEEYYGLKIIIIPDKLYDGLYIKLGIIKSNKDLFLKMARERFKDKLHKKHQEV